MGVSTGRDRIVLNIGRRSGRYNVVRTHAGYLEGPGRQGLYIVTGNQGTNFGSTTRSHAPEMRLLTTAGIPVL